ncbi:SprT family zinc-dependent metalloprotease [Sulfitobacter sp. PR48]|uniref:M48 family metallopeptidase n=1 Tax=Sulfitobacter sp. PR48 TaxID=3028383 RepID=UPI00237B0096|nr:SprT family zinc-dependent metalloprotease [Sulfitobacter sp. PR48]MDD9721781.1 SprT family zinc-dependent metalloprotease [Sulfitobacter sp. PR48]
MGEVIEIGDLAIDVTRKDVKNVHLSVHPPDGRVTLVAPTSTRIDVARAYAITKIGWIRQQQGKLAQQAREAPRQFVGRETHYLWGRRHLLRVTECEGKPAVRLDHRTIHLQVRPESTLETRAKVVHNWHLKLLHAAVPPLIKKWESRIGVEVQGYFLQRMKTKWGSCNAERQTIRLNTELVKKPRDLLEYVVVHEMIHILAPTHSPRFFDLLSTHYPSWSEARTELNELPIPAL